MIGGDLQSASTLSAGLKLQFNVSEINIFLHLIIFNHNYALNKKNKKHIKEVFKPSLLLSLKTCLHVLLCHSVTFLFFHSQISFPAY